MEKTSKLLTALDSTYTRLVSEHETLDAKMDEAMRTDKDVMSSLTNLAICLGKMQMLTEIRCFVLENMKEGTNIGDEVTVCGTIADITSSGNLVIQIKGNGRFVIKARDVKTICPKLEPPKEDKRRGA